MNEANSQKSEKLRVAVQFYGHSRSFQHTFDSFKEYVIKENAKLDVEVDVFIHTWDEKEHTTIKPQYKKDENYAGVNLNNEDLNFIKLNYKPKGFLVESQRKISELQEKDIREKGYDPKNYSIIYNISHSISKSNELRKKYEAEHKISYDFVILTRLDIKFKKPFSLSSIVNGSTKSFMAFDKISDFDSHIFYCYMETNDLVRNQNKYITGIDLFSFGRPAVYDELSKWHDKVLSERPEGTENALTRIINENNIKPMLLYYSKPDSWDILRTNSEEVSKEKSESTLISLDRSWHFEKIEKHYEEILKNDNLKLFDYMVFLADIGKLGKINEVIDFYGSNYIQELIDSKDYKTNKNKNVAFLLRFFKNEFTGNAVGNLIEKLIYRTKYDSGENLLSFILDNESVLFDKNSGSKQNMILNFSINRLLEHALLNEYLVGSILSLYINNNNINNLRKRYMLQCMIDYSIKYKFDRIFMLDNNSINYNKKLLSFLHSSSDYGSLEIYKRFQNHLAKNNIVKNKISHPKVAVCISGMYRVNDSALITIKNNIVDPLAADVFFHTWDQWEVWPGTGGAGNDWVVRLFGGKANQLCPSEIKNKLDLENKFPNFYKLLDGLIFSDFSLNVLDSGLDFKKVEIENEQKFVSSIGKDSDDFLVHGKFNQLKMFYGIWKSHKMAEQYEKHNDIKYDYIIRCRPDVALTGKLNVSHLDSLANDEIGVDFMNYGPQDQFRYGSRNTMIEMASIYESMLKERALSPFEKYKHFFSHNLTLLWMMYNKVYPVKSVIKRDISFVTASQNISGLKDALIKDFDGSASEFRKDSRFTVFFNFILGEK